MRDSRCASTGYDGDGKETLPDAPSDHQILRDIASNVRSRSLLLITVRQPDEKKSPLAYTGTVPLTGFHPTIQRWFAQRFGEPTEPQREGWPKIRNGNHTLISAPTGMGKTLAAYLAAIDSLARQGAALRDETYVLYVSPLRALSNDVQKNLGTFENSRSGAHWRHAAARAGGDAAQAATYPGHDAGVALYPADQCRRQRNAAHGQNRHR